jgi:hypothetical protein
VGLVAGIGPARRTTGKDMRKAIVTGADTNSAITVQWDQCDSRAEFFTGAGWWKKIGSGSTKIQAFDTGSKAFTLDFSCSTKHQYRVHFTQGSNSGYVYYPEDTSQWTTVSSPTVEVK